MKKSTILLALATIPVALCADTVLFDLHTANSSQFSRDVVRAGETELPPSAGIVPFALSIVPPFQFPGYDWDVYGVRVNAFVGHHRDVCFVDIGGFGNIADGNLCGLEVGGLYNRVGSADGAIQIAGLFNYVHHEFCGLEVSLLVNRVDGDMQGMQFAPVNLTQDGAGFQIGAFNRAERFTGLQIGVANYAYQMQGLQIGLFNIIQDSNIPFMPVINAAF